MKRVNSLLIAAFVAASAMFVVSCGEDEENPPEIRFKAGNDFYNDGQKIDKFGEGEVIDATVTYLAGDASRIRKVFATGKYSGADIEYLDTARITGITGDKEVERKFKINVLPGDIVITFKALDNKGVIVGNEFKITVSPKAGSLPVLPAEYESFTVMLGAQASSVGSFYQAVANAAGTVRKVGDVASASNQEKIDFAYYYGTSNKATIVAPNYTWTAGNEMKWGTVAMSTWTTKNSTKFFKVAGANGNEPDKWWEDNIDKAETSTELHANNLTTGNVVVFQTQSGVKGAFVITVNGENAGTASLKIIYEKPR